MVVDFSRISDLREGADDAPQGRRIEALDAIRSWVLMGGTLVVLNSHDIDQLAVLRPVTTAAVRVERADDLGPALERAFANAPAVVDVVTSQHAVSSDAQKGLGYVPDYQPLMAWDMGPDFAIKALHLYIRICLMQDLSDDM